MDYHSSDTETDIEDLPIHLGTPSNDFIDRRVIYALRLDQAGEVEVHLNNGYVRIGQIVKVIWNRNHLPETLVLETHSKEHCVIPWASVAEVRRQV